jgi:starvation-inducible DNA-binding protein
MSVRLGAIARINQSTNQSSTAMAKNDSKQKDLVRRRGAPLVTPSDLGAEASKDIAGGMNAILADVFALYLKTKNFHWHMSGPHFRDYHLLLDDQGAAIYAAIDPLAERVRKLGQPTLTSIGAIAKLTSIKDNDSEYVDPGEMLNELIDDNKTFIAAMRTAHDACDDAKDVATASLLENFIDEAEMRVWFLYEASRRADSTGH